MKNRGTLLATSLGLLLTALVLALYVFWTGVRADGGSENTTLPLFAIILGAVAAFGGIATLVWWLVTRPGP